MHNWQAIGIATRGASHEAKGLPCQDAISWFLEMGSDMVMTVSDGHGDSRSFRSHLGAQFAVEAATASITDFLIRHKGEPNPSLIKRTAEERLPQEIAFRWRSVVQEDLRSRPFENSEMERLRNTSSGEKGEREVSDNPFLAYGATVLAVGITDRYILCLQIGDGDIMIVPVEGEPYLPVPKDARLIGNWVTSLCQPEPWKEFRSYFEVIQDIPPALILLSTDGYFNSFTSGELFLKTGRDYLERIRESGLEAVGGKLETWLTETSKRGSGDDITVGIIYRIGESPKAEGQKVEEPLQTKDKPQIPELLPYDKDNGGPDHQSESGEVSGG